MFIGEFSPSIFFKVCSCVITITLPIIYFISQYLGHQPPFPKCWISDCAAHFPEFVFFRIATISGAVFIILGWLTNHFYLKSISKEKVFRIEAYLPEIPLVMGIMGGMFLMGSTANLDTGKRHPGWHTFCASRFFIFTVLALIYNTVLYCIVYAKIKTVSITNIYFKLTLLAAMIIQAIISLEYGFLEDGEDGGVNSVGIFLEWTLTLTVIANFYSMGLDVENFKYVYETSTREEEEEEEGTDCVD